MTGRTAEQLPHAFRRLVAREPGAESRACFARPCPLGPCPSLRQLGLLDVERGRQAAVRAPCGPGCLLRDNGPPARWTDRYISSYASTHPWRIRPKPGRTAYM